ncbi:hypothetical protein KEM48_002014 [Puccinia striiformis f. sp. tritici PST-130]|nr:hypothetical protein KEM48_002014 [Puccinia striiformis f. sp. tritici PST-130]
METQRYEVDKLSDWLGESTMDPCGKCLQSTDIHQSHQRTDDHCSMTISKPSFKLHRHRSKANSLVFHPTLPLICTSGTEDEDLETLAMFDALLEREKEVGEQSLWLGLDRARDDDDDNELVDDDYLSNDDYSD